ncbi:MAG: HesB/IscA family protein [Acidiferrobacter sp.]
MTITPSALKFMRRMLRMSGNPAHGFRLLAAPGGCSGMSVEFTVEAAAPAGDVTMQYEDVTLHMSPATQALLERCTLDFSDAAHSSGFTVMDPKGSGCGCSSAGAGAAVVDISALKRRS